MDLVIGVIVLLGAELNAEMEHQTVKDSTDGSPRRSARAELHGGSRRRVARLTVAHR